MSDHISYGSWNELIGTTIGPDGRYTIQRKVGEGGMGVVFEAVEAARERAVAVKVLNPEGLVDREVLQRFKREGSRFARLRHPNIVRVYGMGRARGLLYIASEFVRGRNLFQIGRADGPMSIERALGVVADTARGLQVAHEAGVIHRDLKPENVMITDAEGEVKVLDFGVAKDLNASMALTVKGAFIGTPGFSAPEQILGQDIDGRADIFSLGVILYELVTGELPFEDRRTTEVFKKTIKKDPLDPSRLNREVAGPVGELISRMIAKKPRHRPQSCSDVVDEVDRVIAALKDPDLARESNKGIKGMLTRMFKG